VNQAINFINQFFSSVPQMMFANRIFQEEVAMLVQETAQEVAEEYIAEMTESTLDLEEVVKQFRPLDFISVNKSHFYTYILLSCWVVLDNSFSINSVIVGSILLVFL